MELVSYVRLLFLDMGEVEPYGSRVLGTSTDESDHDLALILHEDHDDEDIEYIMEEVVDTLKDGGVGIVTVWPNAKAPLVRCTYRNETFDLVLKSSGGVLCTWLLQEVLATNPKMLKVIRTVKQWAKVNNLLGAHHGKLSSHGLTIFAIHYLVSVGMLGLAHLNGDPNGKRHSPLFDQEEMDVYACFGIQDEELWTVGQARRLKARFVPSFKFLVRGVLFRLFNALSAEPGQGQIYSITTRAREPQPTRALLHIEDPISRGNITSNLKPKPFAQLRDKVRETLNYLSERGTVTARITEPSYIRRYCE